MKIRAFLDRMIYYPEPTILNGMSNNRRYFLISSIFRLFYSIWNYLYSRSVHPLLVIGPMISTRNLFSSARSLLNSKNASRLQMGIFLPSFGSHLSSISHSIHPSTNLALTHPISSEKRAFSTSRSDSKSKSSTPPKEYYMNDDLLRHSACSSGIRVIDSDGNTNLGILSVEEGIQRAREAGLDLLLVSEGAKPPVCRILDSSVYIREKKKAEAEAKKVIRDRKVKEIRLTSRIDDHDLQVKSDRILNFLRSNHPVKVSVSFAMNMWQKEEPARREVFRRVSHMVAEEGVGFCDVSTVSGAGSSLSGVFNPTTKPKPHTDWEKLYKRLSSPIRPSFAEEGKGPAAPPTPQAEVLPSNVNVDELLPSPEVLLRKFGSRPKRVLLSPAKISPVTVEEDDIDIPTGGRRAVAKSVVDPQEEGTSLSKIVSGRNRLRAKRTKE